MAEEKTIIEITGSVAFLQIQTATCDRPEPYQSLGGVTMSAAMVDGEAKIAMSIWLPNSADGLTAMMTHDELLALNLAIKQHHDLICTGEHEGQTKQ